MPYKPRLGLPEIADPRHRRWIVREAELRDSAVDLEKAEAWVPIAYTPAQQLARLHEWGHVKYTPNDWMKCVVAAMGWATQNREDIDPGVALRISKMLEENRIDWLLWKRHDIDLRPTREALDWSGMPVPENPLDALEFVLQLAWTVWASRGLGKGIPKPPPPRDPEEETASYFDKCWQVVLQHPEGTKLVAAVVRSCIAIYQKPTNYTRDRAAAELAVFFKVKKQPQPDEKEEELEEQEVAKQQEQLKEEGKERAKEEEESGGVGNEPTREGIIHIHDHTAGLRRTSVRIARRDQPYDRGTTVRFPYRQTIDGNIYSRRSLSEAGIMVDVSGSMNWTNDKLVSLVNLMPAVNVGVYGGFRTDGSLYGVGADGIYGRICILAKKGRITTYEGKDYGFTGANDIDAEALQWLSRWPEPRLWLSDGYVGGGPHKGPHPLGYQSTYLNLWGGVVHRVNRIMIQYRILRVPDLETMLHLLKRRPVTVYRSCINWKDVGKGLSASLHPTRPAATAAELLVERRRFYPNSLVEEPVRFQL